jgi:hypothetical protein
MIIIEGNLLNINAFNGLADGLHNKESPALEVKMMIHRVFNQFGGLPI